MHKFPSTLMPSMGRSVRLIVSSTTLPLAVPFSSSSSFLAASPFRCLSTTRPALAFGISPGRSKYENSHPSGQRYERNNERRPPRYSSYDNHDESSSMTRYGNNDRRNRSFSKPNQDKSTMYASRGCYNVSVEVFCNGHDKLRMLIRCSRLCDSVETVSS
jgi:hypothetical protein